VSDENRAPCHLHEALELLGRWVAAIGKRLSVGDASQHVLWHSNAQAWLCLTWRWVKGARTLSLRAESPGQRTVASGRIAGMRGLWSTSSVSAAP